MKLMELKHTAAIALPCFPTDNSSSLDVGLFLHTMNAFGGNWVQVLVGYILRFMLTLSKKITRSTKKIFKIMSSCLVVITTPPPSPPNTSSPTLALFLIKLSKWRLKTFPVRRFLTSSKAPIVAIKKKALPETSYRSSKLCWERFHLETYSNGSNEAASKAINKFSQPTFIYVMFYTCFFVLYWDDIPQSVNFPFFFLL